jgi:hypothetical protein
MDRSGEYITSPTSLGPQHVALEKVAANVEEATVRWRQLCEEVKQLKSAKRSVEVGEKSKLSHVAFGELSALEASVEDLESYGVPNSQKREAHALAKVDAAEAYLKAMQRKNLVLRPAQCFEKFPADRHVPAMPYNSQSKKFCPCCDKRGFVACCAITASHGCEFHPACIAQRVQGGDINCPRCQSWFSGAWMAQMGGILTEFMRTEV